MDPGHPFPFISNLALNLLVTLRHKGGTLPHIARVKVPVTRDIAPRFLQVGDERTFVRLDDVVANNMDLLFPGMEIESCELFRVTRNAIVETDEEEADDLLVMIESELRHRHFAPIVRLQITKGMSTTHRGMLAAELGLDEENDVYEVEEIMAMRDLFEIAGLDIPELLDPPHKPIDHTRLAHDTRPIFHKRDRTLRGHVFCSFLALVLRKELERHLNHAGHVFEWADIKQDLKALQQVTIEEGGKQLAIRSKCEGVCGKVFQAVGVAMPPTIREL